jgi:hypothetical protein
LNDLELPSYVSREQIDRLQSELAIQTGELALQHLSMLDKPEQTLLQMPQVECSVVHHFGPSICIREVFMPAGTLAIGHKQKFEQLNIMLRGKVMIVKEDGSIQTLTAPMIFTAKAGRKIGYVLEDMVWQNVYSTELLDSDAVEAFFIEKSHDWQQDQQAKLMVEKLTHIEDREDYFKLLDECGIPHELAKQQSENKYDQKWVDSQIIHVAESAIEGKGLFLTSPIKSGNIICAARIDGYRTQGGRFTNHSKTPNAKMIKLPNGNIDLVALVDIEGCKGGGMGTEVTIDYRQALALSGIEFKEMICQE